MQQGAQEDIDLDTICGHTKACEVQTYIEIPITIKVIRSKEHVQVAHGMNDDEDNEEDGGACESQAVVGKDDVLLAEDSAANLTKHAENAIKAGA